MKYVVSEAHENIFHSLFKSRSFRARKLRNMDSYEHGKKGVQAIFGEEAIEKSILNENLQAGEVPDQASRGSETRGKLPPTDDSQLSPHPELDTMPSEKSKTRVN